MKSTALRSPINGRYHLIREIGRGGMSRVYLAVVLGPADFSKLVVVKVLRRDRAEDVDGAVEMFMDEARLAARMSHPNVVQTVDFGSADDRVFLVMEHLDGQPLSRILRKAADKPHTWPLAAHLSVLHEALAGLHYAHEVCDYDGRPLELVHRDVSPQNVFVTFDGETKVLDFGIAKSAVSEHRTQLGLLKGKMSYLAPEYAKGEPVSRAADIFAAGVMLYEALCGRRMWQGRGETEIFRSLVGGQIPDIHATAPRAPRPLRDACARALTLDPSKRFETLAQLQHEIGEWLTQNRSRLSSSQIGALVAATFENERRAIAQEVAERIRLLRTGAPLPSLAPASAARSSLVPDPISDGSRASYPPSSSPNSERSPSTPAISRPSISRHSRGSISRPLHTVTFSGGLSASPRGARPWARWLAIGGGIVLLTAALATRIWGTRSNPLQGDHSAELVKPSPSSLSADTAYEANRPPPAKHDDVGAEVTASESRVALVLRASPPGAVWTLDDMVLEGNPVVVRLDRSVARRHIEVTAPGYVPVERDIVADRDALVEIHLRPGVGARRQAPRSAQRAESPPPASPPASSASRDAFGRSPETGWDPSGRVRVIDTSDPFAPGASVPGSRVRVIDTSDPFARQAAGGGVPTR